MEVRVQQRVRAIEVEKADAEVIERGEGGEGTHGLDDEFLEGVDEVDLIDTRRVIVATDVVVAAAAAAAAVAHDEINGFQAGRVAEFLGGFAGGCEEAAADTARVAESFEIGEDVADVGADVEHGIETAPFVW